MLKNLSEFAHNTLSYKALDNTRETSVNTRDFTRTKSTKGFLDLGSDLRTSQWSTRMQLFANIAEKDWSL